jgi:signal peptidase II
VHDEMVEPPACDGPAAAPESMGALRRLAANSRLLGLLSGGIVILDQVAKAIVRASLQLHESVTIVPGFLNLTHVRNTGAAFGLLNSADIPLKPALMTGIALVALIAIGYYALQTTSREPFARLGLTLILGGAVGNLIDRITAGYVVDFVDVYAGDWHFWAFNVADSAITVGAGLLILDLAFLNRHVSETA